MPAGQRRGEHVDPLVHAGAADGLGPEQPAVGGEHHGHVHLLGPGEVAGVVARVGVHHVVRDPCGAQLVLAGPGHRCGQAEHPHHRRADHGPGQRGLGQPAEDRVRGATALAVGRAGERDRPERAGDAVTHGRRVADRPDVRVGGALSGVDDDRALGRQLEAGAGRQVGVGAHADGQHDEVGRQDRAVGERDLDGVVRVPGGADRLGGHAHVGAHAVRGQLVVQQARELGVQRRQHVGSEVDEVHVEAPLTQRLGGLQADEAGAEDHRAVRGVGQQRPDRVGVRDAAQGVDLREVDAVDRWADRRSAGSQHERVVVDHVGATREADGHLLGGRVDRESPRAPCARRG